MTQIHKKIKQTLENNSRSCIKRYLFEKLHHFAQNVSVEVLVASDSRHCCIFCTS